MLIALTVVLTVALTVVLMRQFFELDTGSSFKDIWLHHCIWVLGQLDFLFGLLLDYHLMRGLCDLLRLLDHDLIWVVLNYL